jgi:hypothetical protein
MLTALCFLIVVFCIMELLVSDVASAVQYSAVYDNMAGYCHYSLSVHNFAAVQPMHLAKHR